MMRRTLYILAFILAAQLNLRAQEQPPASPDKKDKVDKRVIFVIGGYRESPFDHYGEIPFMEECLRLDKFALELQRQPDKIGYIIAYSQQGEDSRKSAERLEQARHYLTFGYGIEEKRIMALKACGNGAIEFELWIDRPGTYLPNSAPTVKLVAKVKTATKAETQSLPNKSL